MIWANSGEVRVTNKVHAHDMNELVVCLGDTGTHVIQDRPYPFCAGSTVFLPGGIPHYVVGSEAGVARIEFVCFDHQWLADRARSTIRESLDTLTLERRFAAVGGDDVRRENLALSARLRGELRCVRFLGQALASGLIAQLLVNHCRALLSCERPLADDHSKRIARVCTRITEHPSAPVELHATACDAGMSRTQFVRQFRKHTGMTLIEYTLSVRLHRAIEILMRSDRKISDIALDCGFNNLGYFHRCFRRHWKMTPRAFRLRTKGQGRPPTAYKIVHGRET